jgi:colanic acid/amylovoran biosynthesis glycosyltransferase
VGSAGSRPRPAVSVCVPFLGGRAEAVELLESLSGLELRGEDEVVVADNTEAGLLREIADQAGIRAVPATSERSSYHARNVAANAAANPWLLFIDADCRPVGDIVERYFRQPVSDDEGAVAGAVHPLSRGRSLMSRYAASRGGNQQEIHLRNSYKPFGVTANLLVRRDAWEDVGGFQEGIRSGGDADFCWRIQDAGWKLGYREGAEVRHLLREDLRSYLRVHVRYGAGLRWLRVRHPRAHTGPAPRRVLRRMAGVVIWPLAGQLERGLFMGLDIVVILTETAGYTLSNAARGRPETPARAGRRLVVLADRFPEPSETFVVNEVKALAELHLNVRVEARARPTRPAIGAMWGLDVRYREDRGTLGTARDLIWLVTRHPLRSLTDLVARRRWRREERVTPLRGLAPLARRLIRERVEHMHVHFARRSALDALRIHRLLGTPYSLTAHAQDIFVGQANLVEKIERSAFTTTGCDYNVRHLRGISRDGSYDRIHKIVMGVDPKAFSRMNPYDADGTVLAVGRLVEKKGFAHLIEAAARLRDFELLRRVVIVGEGPLREELEAQSRELGVHGLVEFTGPKRPDDVRALMENAAILAMPAVVARDGDRDSMPVVVKEALAMGVPVVASDEVGLPEVVRDGWGRLVPPGDVDALVEAIRELLAMPSAERARMGERGRRFVLDEYQVSTQTERLVRLIEDHG